MNAQVLLTELRNRGVRVEPRPTGNLYLAPKNRLTPELVEKVRTNKADLLVYLRTEQESAKVDRLASADGWKPLPPTGHPAYSILATCLHFGVALRIGEAGDLVVGKAGAKADDPTRPWPSLLCAIEAHLEAVAALVETGWTLTAAFPKEAAA